MRLLISFAALFLSVVLLQLGTGGVAPLDALSGVALGFSAAEIGSLGSAHFLGFFIGCWWAPRLMGTVGHSRAFAAFTAAGTIGLIAHMMIVDPLAWAVLRLASGACVAGCYTVIEAWLQAKVTNETRGRAMGIYRIVDIGGSLGAQLVIGILSPAAYFSYNLLALLCCAALLPVTVSRAEQPAMPAAPRLRPALAWVRSPLAAIGVVVAGVTGAAFRMVGHRAVPGGLACRPLRPAPRAGRAVGRGDAVLCRDDRPVGHGCGRDLPGGGDLRRHHHADLFGRHRPCP